MRGPAVYERVFRHGITRVDAEVAHERTFEVLRGAGAVLRQAPVPAGRPVEAMGLRFPNVLGLAAGFDKRGQVYREMAAFGFGHVEIGTITALAQPGNPRPRLVRLPADQAVVNRMGFNNDGAAAVAERLAAHRRRPGGPVLGINIGKSKVVPEDDQEAVEADYTTSTRLLAPYADYLVVNVSSPNTPGLRSLQAVERLAPLLARVRQEADAAADSAGRRPPPLLVKIAPDLADDDVLAVADLALDLGLAGIIATNTTISRAGLTSSAEEVEAAGPGGLSGRPLRERATAVLRLLRERVGPRTTLVGVGGITTAEDALDRLHAGADLVQAYTGLVYGGPMWPRRILKGIGR